jgi:hypothetical protein
MATIGVLVFDGEAALEAVLNRPAGVNIGDWVEVAGYPEFLTWTVLGHP